MSCMQRQWFSLNLICRGTPVWVPFSWAATWDRPSEDTSTCQTEPLPLQINY